jgi:hypothetical protein
MGFGRGILLWLLDIPPAHHPFARPVLALRDVAGCSRSL